MMRLREEHIVGKVVGRVEISDVVSSSRSIVPALDRIVFDDGSYLMFTTIETPEGAYYATHGQYFEPHNEDGSD